MLRLESYLAPFLSGFLNKYIRNLKADALQLSIWGGEVTFQHLELRLDNIENEFDLPLELNSGSIRELKIRIPWTRLGSEPVSVTIDGLELHCRMRKPQQPVNFTQTASSKEQFDGDADRRTSRVSSSVYADGGQDDYSVSNTDRGRQTTAAQEPGYLTTLLRKAKINARVTVKNLTVQYYISSEVVLNIVIAELDFGPTDAAWKSAYLALPAPREEFALRRQINVRDLTVRLNDKRIVKTEREPTGASIAASESVLVKTCSFTCRSETIYNDFSTRAIKSVHFHSYFDAVDLIAVTDHIPHLVRLYEYVIAFISGYVPTAREIRRLASKLPLNVAVSNASNNGNASAEDASWTGWAKSWIGYSNELNENSAARSPAAYNDAGVQEVIDFLDDDDADDVTANADEIEYALFCRQGTLTFATLQANDNNASSETTPVPAADDVPTVHTDAQKANRTILPFLKIEGRGICARVRLTAANKCVNITGHVVQATGSHVNFYGYPFPEPIFCMHNNLLASDVLTKHSLFDLDRAPPRNANELHLPKTVAEHLAFYNEQLLLSRNHALLWDFVKFKNSDYNGELLPAEQRMRRQNVILRIFTASLQLLIDDCFAQRLNLLYACIYEHYPYKRPLITPDDELVFDTLPLHLAEEESAHMFDSSNAVPTKTLNLVVPGVEAIVVGLHGMVGHQRETEASMPAAWFPFLCDDVALQEQQGAAAIVLRSPRFEWALQTPLDHEQIYEIFITLLSSGGSNRCDALKHLLFQTQTIRMFSWNAFATIFTASNSLTSIAAYASLARAPAKLLTTHSAEFEYRFTCAPYARAFPLHDVAVRYTQIDVKNIEFVGSGADLLLAWNCLCVTFWPDMYVDEQNITENVRQSVLAGSSNYYARMNKMGEINTAAVVAVHRMSLRMPSVTISFSAYKSGNFRQHHQFQVKEAWLLPSGSDEQFCLLKTFTSSAGELPAEPSYFTQDIVLDVDQQLRTLAGRRGSVEVRRLREKYGIKHSVLHIAESLQVSIAAEHVEALLNFVMLSKVAEVYAAIVGEDDADVEHVAENDGKPTRTFRFNHPVLRFRYSANEKNFLDLALTSAKLHINNNRRYYSLQYDECNVTCIIRNQNETLQSSPPICTLINGNLAVERHYMPDKYIVIGRADSIPISFSPASLKTTLMLAKFGAQNAETFRGLFLPASTGSIDALSQQQQQDDLAEPHKKSEVISHDDLRALPWKYIFHTSPVAADVDTASVRSAAPLPKRGEIVFDEGVETSGNQNVTKSMTWHYGEARSITTLKALPVPLCTDATEDATVGNANSTTASSMPFRILCILFYYDDLNGIFKSFKTFCLSETQEFLLNDSELLLPNAARNRNSSRKRSSNVKPRNDSDSIECIPVAETWRIEIQPALQDVQQRQQDFTGFSVAALGACLIIDSCINYCAAPRMQLKLSCQRTELLLSYCAADAVQQQNTASAAAVEPGILSAKTSELVVPVEMLRILVEDVEMVARIYSSVPDASKQRLPVLIIFDVCAWLQASATELASLTRLPLLDPLCANVSGTLVRQSSACDGASNAHVVGEEQFADFFGLSYAKLNASLSAGTGGVACATLHMNPSILHSLLHAANIWKCGMRNGNISTAAEPTICPFTNTDMFFGAHTLLCNNISHVTPHKNLQGNLAPALYYRQDSTSSSSEDAGQCLNSKQIVPIYTRPAGGARCRLSLCLMTNSERIAADADFMQLQHWIALDLPPHSSPLGDKSRNKKTRQWSKSLRLVIDSSIDQRCRVTLHCLQLNNIQTLYMLTGNIVIFNDTHMPIVVGCRLSADAEDEIAVSPINVCAFTYESCATPESMQELNVQFSAFVPVGKLGEAKFRSSELVKIFTKIVVGERRTHCVSKLVRLSETKNNAQTNKSGTDLYILLNVIVKSNGIVVMHLTPPMFVNVNSAITWPVYLQPLDVTTNSVTLSSSPVGERNAEQYALIDVDTKTDSDFEGSMIALYNLDLEQCSKLSVKLNTLSARPTTCVDLGRVTLDERQIKQDIMNDCPLALIRQHFNETPNERRARIGKKALFEPCQCFSELPLLHRAYQPAAIGVSKLPPPPDVVPISKHAAVNSSPVAQRSAADAGVYTELTARVITHPVLPGCKVLELIPQGLILRNDMRVNFEVSLLSASRSGHTMRPAPVYGESTSFMPISASVFTEKQSSDNAVAESNSNSLDCPVRLRILPTTDPSGSSETGEIIFRVYASKETKKLKESKNNGSVELPNNLDDAVDCTEYGALPRGGVLRLTLASTTTIQQMPQLCFVRFLLIYLYTDPNGLHVLHIRNGYPVSIPRFISEENSTVYKLFAWPVGDASAMPSLDDLTNHIPVESCIPKEAWPVLVKSSSSGADPVADNIWRRTRYVPAVLPIPAGNSERIKYCCTVLDPSTYKRLTPRRVAAKENDENEDYLSMQLYAHAILPVRNAAMTENAVILTEVIVEDAEDSLYHMSRVQLTIKRRGQLNVVKIGGRNLSTSFVLDKKSANPAESDNIYGALLFAIDNCCEHEIAVGESLPRRAAVLNEKSQTFEDELFYRLPPVVPVSGRLYYTPPSQALENTNFDDASQICNAILRFGRLVAIRDPKRPTCIWSEDEVVLGPSVCKNYDQPIECFVSVAGLCNLKLTCERVRRRNSGDEMYRIRIDPAGKVNLDAWRRTAPTISTKPTIEVTDAAPVTARRGENRSDSQPFVATIKLQSLCICVEDTLLAPNALVELVRVTLDRFQSQVYAVANMTSCELAVTLHSAQIDNQLALLPPALQQELLGFTNGYFDFPVVLVKGDTNETTDASGKTSVALASRREKSQPVLNFVLNIALRQQLTTATSNIIELRKLFVSTSPCSVFLEDRFVYTLLQLSDHFIVPDLIEMFVAGTASPTPEVNLNENTRTSTLIAIDKLFIAPLFINLSLHASLSGLFVAVNSSPLFFDELALGHGIKCTPTELAATLFMHYASVTLLKAGMVLGSADLLGNPVNLLRSFGRGIHDAFLLPWLASSAGRSKSISSSNFSRSRSTSGAEGRISFSEALTQGARSLFSNISMGSLTSLTRWFESLSRNLDNLVYDPAYMRRRMELTANPGQRQFGNNIAYDGAITPVRLQSGRNAGVIGDGEIALMTTPPSVVAPMLVGLQHGLAGFGFSLLGALAGVIDQPMRAASQAYNEGRSDATPRAVTTMEGGDNLYIIDVNENDEQDDSDEDGGSSKSGSILRALLTGLGRGLLGMLTKPLAGATSLVAQTGAGLLEGMAVARPPTPRFHNHVLSMSECCSSSLKIPRSFTIYSSNRESPIICVQVVKNSGLSKQDCVLLLTRSFVMEMGTEGAVTCGIGLANVLACKIVNLGLSSSSSTTSSMASGVTENVMLEFLENASTQSVGGDSSSVNLHSYAVRPADVADVQLFCGLLRLLQVLL